MSQFRTKGNAPQPQSGLNPDRLFDNHLQYQFEIATNVCRDEHDLNGWYGPWNTLLLRLFRAEDGPGFQVAPQHVFSNKTGNWTIFYLITSLNYKAACVVDIKPLFHYHSPSSRVDAYKQLEDRVLTCIDTSTVMREIPVIYGLSCIGHRFMIMKTCTKTGISDPPLDKNLFRIRRAPAKWWHCKAHTRNGAEALVRLVADIKSTLPNYKSMPSVPVVLPDDLDSSDDEGEYTAQTE